MIIDEKIVARNQTKDGKWNEWWDRNKKLQSHASRIIKNRRDIREPYVLRLLFTELVFCPYDRKRLKYTKIYPYHHLWKCPKCDYEWAEKYVPFNDFYAGIN